VGTEKRERQKANRALKHQQQQQAVSRRKLYRKVAIGVVAVAALIAFVWIASNVVGDDDEPSTPVTPVTLPETIDTVGDTVDDTVPADTVGETVPATTEG
jgi:hypothetical protein